MTVGAYRYSGSIYELGYRKLGYDYGSLSNNSVVHGDATTQSEV